MKDLTYLYEFEKLLESANNPLVQQACAEGKHALAYTCYHMPEVLLNTGDCAADGVAGHLVVLHVELHLRLLQVAARARHRGGL